MSKENKETLNQVEGTEETKTSTTESQVKYKLVKDAPQFYVQCVKEFRQYSKGEIFTQEQIIHKLQEIFENYE
jgi:hypothetical protein|tara:strand:- start:109 stop:327 length:219 start_codon:yes stop_codon:yes gene_type:complete